MITEKFITKISSVLERLNIDYVIAGGIAVSVWGKPRHTADVDIVINTKTIESIRELVDLLRKEIEKSYLDKDRAIDAFKRKSEFNLVEPEYGLKADFFVADNSEYRQLEIKRGKNRKIGRKFIKFISPEDLIISKLIWFRESQSTRQLEDIASVMFEQKNLDKPYILKWVKKLGLEREWGQAQDLTRK